MQKKIITGVTIIVLVLLVNAGILYIVKNENDNNSVSGSRDLKTFSDFLDLKDYYYNRSTKESKDSNENNIWRINIGSNNNANSQGKMPADTESLSFSESTDSSSGGSEYSTTNIQVSGVDEGDIVKNDGKYAYIVSRNRTEVFIIDVYPPNNAKLLATIEMDFLINEIYLNGNYLTILGVINYNTYYLYNRYNRRYQYPYTYIQIYNVEQHSNPVLERSVNINGSYLTSRMIGDHFYVIASQYIYNIETAEDLPVPPDKIYYTECDESNYYFTHLVSLNIKDRTVEPKEIIVLLGSSGNIYVSPNNIYLTSLRYSYYSSGFSSNSLNNDFTEMTAIHRLAIKDGAIEYITSGFVPGHILNRFSMDEYDRHFRVATTVGQVSRYSESTSTSHVFIFNMNMELVGQVDDIAPGETIYSARFMGERAYIVTFKKVDPFFVVDLSNPRYPKILGQLKIPGYSNYLHPYDKNHVIGIGKDTVEADEGNFGWYQGVKISLFDVSNVLRPREEAKFIIGDRGTESDALYDPHAFLFDRERNLLVIPIILAEIDQERYSANHEPNIHGEYTWSGVYVFRISEKSGIKLRGKITHLDYNDQNTNDDQPYYYYYYSKYTQYKVKRSFYIENVLYTVSDYKLKANNLDRLSEIETVELPNIIENYYYWE